ncbi:DeoR/GlpR family DNA-binding transcription regulator [Kribbella sp. NPDC000426]|uniref:DeoR/GlpR family DNA-binding transcription regulator n=1 Tax=Kribbella sp. NPDC000426 TaxID=3154255 RepID=UPI00332EA4D0
MIVISTPALPAVRCGQPSAPSPRRAQRLVEILDLLSTRGALSVDTMCHELQVSPATLRRDMTHLEEQGLVSRTRGGARANTGPELPVQLRDTRSPLAKRAIAVKAASLLPADRPLAVAIGGGSTTAEVARQLGQRRRLTIVTNALTTAAAVASQPNLQIIMTGGVIRSNSFELVGSLAESAFNGMSVNLAILGADGVSAAHGVTTHDHTEARTNHAMVSHAHRLMVVADGSKIGAATVAKVADASAVDLLVTDASADPQELARLTELGVTVHVAGASRKTRVG